MVIQIDSREKTHAISRILAEFDTQNIKHPVSKLFVGDYMSLDNARLVIDRKKDLLEVCLNVCQQHKRFISELKRANENGITIVFLVEHSKNIKSLDDVQKWVNPRLKTSKLAMSGERLYKVLKTLEKTYNTRFLFCDKANTGKRIISILSGEEKVDVTNANT
jgi:ERCC4-type nuclease